MTFTATEELFAPVGRGIELCYQTFGDPDGEPLLLVMGLGGPMTWWDPDLCTTLAERGFFVVRFDNRDTGRSTKVEGRVPAGCWSAPLRGAGAGAVLAGRHGRGRVRAAGPPRSRVRARSGVSMGGMIAQTMAIARPDRVRSLTSIMSTTGKRTVGWQHPGPAADPDRPRQRP